MEYVNSCLMLSLSLWTGVDLSAVFKDEDLKDTGIERDSHITVFFSPDKVIPREGMLEKIKTILGDDNNFLESFKTQDRLKVMDYFEIFMNRMVLCRKAADKLGLQFKLIINEQQLI